MQIHLDAPTLLESKISMLNRVKPSNALCYQLPVRSAPSSMSAKASLSWKLSSWYKLFPARVSLQCLEIRTNLILQVSAFSNSRFLVRLADGHRCGGSRGGGGAEGRVLADIFSFLQITVLTILFHHSLHPAP